MLKQCWNSWKRFITFKNGQIYSYMVIASLGTGIALFIMASEFALFGFLALAFIIYALICTGTLVFAVFSNARWVRFEGLVEADGKKYYISGSFEESTLFDGKITPVGESIKLEPVDSPQPNALTPSQKEI